MEFREFRAEVSEESGKLSGVAAPFGSETTIGRLDRGGWREEIAPGAFTKALKESDTVLLCDHDMSKPLARVSAGTLHLREDAKALHFDADTVDTSYARDLRANIAAGNKGGMSIGFDPVKDDWFDDQGQPSNRQVGTRRVIREVRLPEVSCVTNPAYKDTAVYARDDSQALLEERAGNPKPYGEVKYADPKNGKYPIDTEQHIRAAWSYINMPKNAAEYPLNGVTLGSVKAAIKRAGKHFGIKFNRDGDAVTETRIKKGTAKRVVQMKAELDEAVRLLGEASLDDEGRAALALVSSAATHAGHIKHTEKLGGKKGQKATRSQEPESTTPDEGAQLALQIRAKDALRRQRSRELGEL